MNPDPRRLHRLAVDAATQFVEHVTIADLGRATPCGSWTLADLLAHMVGQHRGFAHAVIDHDAPEFAYQPVTFDPSSWESSISALLEAFDDAVLDDTAVLIEVSPAPLPISWIVSAQTLDTAVHTWDIAGNARWPTSGATHRASAPAQPAIRSSMAPAKPLSAAEQSPVEAGPCMGARVVTSSSAS
jgi:uncharacterized protein (TIGR03086 family)